MVIECAWCKKILGEKPPYEDRSITSSICDECRKKYFGEEDEIMDRAKYNSCMSPYMKGQMPVEERRLKFCVGSKLCSGKAKSEEEARRICSQPKPPKPESARRVKKPVSCEKEMFQLTECMVEHIDMDQASNVNSIGSAIMNALMACRCPDE